MAADREKRASTRRQCADGRGSARQALDLLEVAPGATVAVIGEAGAVGGYAVQLAKAAGLTVIADAAERDRDLVAGLGADHLVPRGDGFAEAVRALRPDGVAGLVDAARFTATSADAVRDGAVVATLRPAGEGSSDRGVHWRAVNVIRDAHDAHALNALRHQAESGVLTLRVAAAFTPEQAARAHALLEAGASGGAPS